MSITILKEVFEKSGDLKPGAAKTLLELLRSGAMAAVTQANDDVPTVVREIIERVRDDRDTAVKELTERFDRITIQPSEVRVPVERIEEALNSADKEFLSLARKVIKNIREYQEHIKIKAPPDLIRGGRRLGVRYMPMDRVGVYVPGGRAIYPSTVLMTVVPAQVAGVKEIAIAAPPTPDGVNEMTMALAGELGIEKVYRVGGAIAIAALAYGTENIQRVDMIAGPGNAYVAEAKLQVNGQVAIDSVAGASEVFIIADESANAAWIAADMLAQAEHNPGSAILITDSEKLANSVREEVDLQLAKLDRQEAARHSIEKYSGIICVSDIGLACDLANVFAPEHLQITTQQSGMISKYIRHAGAIFLGANTPVPLGDYYAGPSHVLPMRGYSRQSSALSVNSFLKASSVLEYDAAALKEDAADVAAFARYEGLTAHAAAVEIRAKDAQGK